MTRSKKKLDFNVTENGCFVPTTHRLNGDGYCYLYHNRKEVRAHRFIYEECFGEIPDGLVVRHKCDNRGCINPEHLELGTHADNMKDKIERGRIVLTMGEGNGRSVITNEIARQIKIMLRDGKKPTEIARTLKVSLKPVRSIKEHNAWSHVVI